MVLFTPNTIKLIKEYLLLNNDAILVINFFDLCLDSSFNNFDILKGLNIRNLLLSHISCKEKDIDTSYLLNINSLVTLDDRNSELPYDFSRMPNLEVLRYGWTPKCKNLNTYNILIELGLWGYKPKSKDLTAFSTFTNLIELRLLQSNIRTIIGLEKTNNIKTLSLVYNRALDLKNVDFVMESVEDLYIENCPKINKEDVIRIFPNVKSLVFASKRLSKDIKRYFIENLKNLKEFDETGCN